jgi:acyl carrier protein
MRPIYSQLTEIFRNLFDDNSIVLTPETTAADIEEWDSFNHINLIVAIETHFGIKFKTAELDQLHNVGHLAEAIERKLGAEAVSEQPVKAI